MCSFKFVVNNISVLRCRSVEVKITSVELTSSSIDANKPSVESISINDGIYGVGSEMVIFITAANSDAGLQALDPTFNDKNLSNFSDLQNGLYALTYLVEEGDIDQADGAAVEANLTFVDAVGNVGASTTEVNLSGASIDANSPAISAISVEAGNHGIGAVVTITIGAKDSDTNLSLADDSSFNGGTLTGLVAVAGQDGTYTATYTVTAGQSDVAAENNVTTTITLLDSFTNPSATITSVPLSADTSIDANAPTAKAGNNQAVNEGDTVELNASNSSDAHAGSIVAYSWQQTGDLSTYQADLSAANTSVASFTPEGLSADATLTFLLTVTDGGNNNDTDTVEVHVNNAPTANAGTDQEVNENDQATLNGSTSQDTDGGTISFLWQLSSTSGDDEITTASITLDDNTSATPNFTAPEVDQDTNLTFNLTFNLTVTDDDGAIATDSVIITVNNAPTAVATASPSVVNENKTVSLAAAGSADAGVGSSIVSYSWEEINGSILSDNDINISNSTSSSASFTSPSVASDTAITLQLTVTDDDGASSTATTTVLVNNAPDVSISVDGTMIDNDGSLNIDEGDSVLLEGSSTDSDELSYQWQQVNSDSTTSINSEQNYTFDSSELELTADASYTLRFTVTDEHDASSSQDITIYVTNTAPTASATATTEVNESTTGVALNGSASSGGVSSYKWEQLNASDDYEVDIINSDQAKANFTAPTLSSPDPITLTFQLTVDDGDTETARNTSRVEITVRNLPTISSITIADETIDGIEAYGIGDKVTVDIQAGNNETGLTLKGDTTTDGTFNGQKLTDFKHFIGGLYTATYTVQDGDTDVAEGESVVTNITLVDSAGNESETKEGLNRSFFLRRSSHGGIFRGRRCGFCLLSLTLSYFFVALMPFVRLFLHNRRTMTY